MERSRSKRTYYNDNHQHNNHQQQQQRRGGGGGGGGGFGSGSRNKFQQQEQTDGTVTTSFRILCHDMKAGGVIGKSGSIIKTIRQHTGAWINVHELVAGDEERTIEIAQDGLFLVHERTLKSCFGAGYTGGNGEEEDYGGFNGGRVVTRLVVSRMHVGLLGRCCLVWESRKDY